MTSKASGPSELTNSAIRRMFDHLDAAFQAGGVRLQSLALWEDLSDLRWILNFKSPPDAGNIDRRRAARAFLDAVFVDRLARSFYAARNRPGFKTLNRHWRNLRLRKGRPLQRNDGEMQAWDLAYEVEIASRLHAAKQSPTFAEPDVFCSLPRTGETCFACKRPRSAKSIFAAVQKGVRQVQKHDAVGLVAVCLDNLVAHDVSDPHFAMLKEECIDRVLEVIENVREKVLYELGRAPLRASAKAPVYSSGAVGVIFTATFRLRSLDLASRRDYLNHGFVTEQLVRQRDRKSRRLAKQVRALVAAGDMALAARD